MKVDVRLEGADLALEKIARLVELNAVKTRDAVLSILTAMRDYAKDYAPFTDRTGNLRNSIQFEMDPNGLPAGTLYAGMEYAVYVEFRDGYWVLQGAIDYYEPIINKLFSGLIKVDRQELDAKYFSKANIPSL